MAKYTLRTNKCRWCGGGQESKAKGKIRFYVIADDLEQPKPYHDFCKLAFNEFVNYKLFDLFPNYKDETLIRYAEEHAKKQFSTKKGDKILKTT